MPKLTIRDWLWSQHCPPEVLADFEKLFGLPEKWHKDARAEDGAPERFALLEQSGINWCADELEAILGKNS